MRHLPLALLVCAALLVPAAASTASSSCGRVNGGFELHIRATGVSCATARSVARGWHKKALAGGPGKRYFVRGFHCRSRSAGDPEHVNVTCSSGAKRVRFTAGP